MSGEAGSASSSRSQGRSTTWSSSIGYWSPPWSTCVTRSRTPLSRSCTASSGPPSPGRSGSSALLAERGFAVPDRTEVRLRTLADVFAYADAEDVTLRIDGTETQVRRPHSPARPRGVHLGQEEAEHVQDHHHQRRPGPHPVVRGRPARKNARPDRHADRRRRRAVPPPSESEGRGRRGISGPGATSSPVRSAPREKAEGRRPARRAVRLARGAPINVSNINRTSRGERGLPLTFEPGVPERSTWPLHALVGPERASSGLPG